MTKRLMKAKHPNEIVDVIRVALKKPSRRPPLSVDGAIARQRLDRPSRRLGRGEGGAVALPVPSLADASKGIGYDDMHREIRKGERRHELAGGDPDDIKTMGDAQRPKSLIAIEVTRNRGSRA